MCLEKVTEKNPEKKEGFGYKVFGGRLLHDYIPEFRCVTTPLVFKDRWNKSSTGMIGWIGKKYKAGFHIFATLHAAKRWATCWASDIEPGLIVCRVQYREAVAVGRQTGFKVIVARQIKIIKEVT